MSRTWKRRSNTQRKPLRAAYKHEIAYRKPTVVLRTRCLEGHKPKVCYTLDEAQAFQGELRGEGLARRIYPCGTHYHLTSRT